MLKRLFDILLACFALTVGMPLMLITAVYVWVFIGRPILFVQHRPGFRGRPFRLFKFRTMRNELGADGHPLTDAARLGPAGRFLRATSLDELPEFWNILKGDMSVVGPRPLLTEYLPLYNAHQARRHEVRPGITGWAQVNGRNALTWERRFDLDVWYVDHHSLWLDLKIIAMTVGAVLSSSGITSPGQATQEAFRGGKPDGAEAGTGRPALQEPMANRIGPQR
jgi:lipopolysaccharide/colanic/teichoic acid biosynthesis glycosyltransferase